MHASEVAEATSATNTLAARRARLSEDIDAAMALPGIDAATLERLRDKLAARMFNLVVVGEFKRGKSSVVNALVGAELLPTAVVPLTSVVTILQHAEAPLATVVFAHRSQQPIGLEAVADYVTERGNPHNRRQVQEVRVAYPAPWLGQGIRLIDTPGIGSAYQHNTDVTFSYLPQADAVIFVASVDQPVSRAELKFLGDIHNRTERVFCLLNKIDHLCSAELVESLAFSTAALRTVLGDDVQVFPVSARVAIEAAQRNGAKAADAGGFGEFNATLRTFIARDSDTVLLDSVRRHLARLLAACRLSAELELKALTAPLETLKANLHAFASKKAEIAQQRVDFAALLDADAKRLVHDTVEPAIADFKTALAQRLEARAAEWVQQALQQRDLSPQLALEQAIVADVRQAYDGFRRQQDAAIAAQFEAICSRFRKRIDASADELMAYSAHLFDVRFNAITTEPLREARSHFYYKFWQEHDSMGLLADTLTGWLPRTLQRPLLMRRARYRTTELVEMQAGRMRHDLDDRIAQAARAERKQVLERIDTTIAGIESAIAKGRDLQRQDAKVVNTRRSEVDALLATIDKLSDH